MTMTKHKMKIQFNEPSDQHFLELKFHALGPHTAKMNAEMKEFRKSLAVEPTWYDKPTDHAYLKLEVAMTPGHEKKYYELCQELDRVYTNFVPKRGKKYEPEIFIKFFPEDDKITIKIFIQIPSSPQ